jgi:hypothetical protein
VLRNRTRQPTVETVRGSGAKIYVFYLQCRWWRRLDPEWCTDGKNDK